MADTVRNNSKSQTQANLDGEMMKLTADDLPRLITKYLKLDNPQVTLPSGEEKHFNDLDIRIEEESNAYYDLYFELLDQAKEELEAAYVVKKADAPQHSPARPLVSPEEETKQRISTLEREAAELRLRVKGGELTKEIFRELDEKDAELKDLKNRLRRELMLKERYKAEFLRETPGTEQDFEPLWIERLRDEAILSEVKNFESLRRNELHPMYKSL